LTRTRHDASESAKPIEHRRKEGSVAPVSFSGGTRIAVADLPLGQPLPSLSHLNQECLLLRIDGFAGVLQAPGGVSLAIFRDRHCSTPWVRGDKRDGASLFPTSLFQTSLFPTSLFPTIARAGMRAPFPGGVPLLQRRSNNRVARRLSGRYSVQNLSGLKPSLCLLQEFSALFDQFGGLGRAHALVRVLAVFLC